MTNVSHPQDAVARNLDVCVGWKCDIPDLPVVISCGRRGHLPSLDSGVVSPE
jgi:hypothetical protein